MKQETITGIISSLLILLFVYAAVSKLVDFPAFERQMLHQPLPEGMAVLLVWTLPPVELVIVGLLIYVRTRLVGLYLSLALMILFTSYIALAIAGTFGSIPCVCGGVLESLDWNSHLVFNAVFTLLALAGVVTTKKNNLKIERHLIK